ncbi:peptidyl-dipeptidase Dcp [Tangfeifania diversioriginum]|uniref:Peptidyl-dipeptidase Dcp n=1 Tax=Tangfeifania diversioriginum TaxID=1168035 RepID=A0A1M6HMZ5_9BACT|nr:M3 family metallopeptidase [Tangfeifania diversioriginum]SHJ23621.1 peptidyl-dipeptidase Dcp [Tangfeifania diversioriginum]
MNEITNNPLLQEFKTPHETAPFAEIKNEHFLPAFKEAINIGEAEVKNIVENPDVPTFENTVEALERAGRLLNRTAGVFFNLLHAETNEELQNLAQEVSPLLTKFENDITLNPELFARIKAVYNLKGEFNLTVEQQTLLEETYLNFERKGANLPEEKKEQFREISTELAQLTLKFGENVLKETNKYEKHITDKRRLSGLPESLLEAAAAKAKSKGKEGWIFDITMPVYQPFMKYADDRELREEMFMAYMSKSFKGDGLDNRKNIIKIVNLRLELARLLGYKNYADYVLERKMAQNTKGVYQLLDELFEASAGVAKKEKAEVEAFARELRFNDEIMPWDWSYYSEKLKIKKFELDDEKLKPYFELNRVIDGVFGLATSLYGITFKPNKEIPVYHEEVVPYEVYDGDGEFLSVLYTDFHPRPGKQGGAWMNDFKGQWKEDGKNSRPHIAIVMNFTRPTETKPALLTFREVETFMHEFGHALHGMLANATYSALSGTNVYHDFVELPSQIMENWAVEKDFLDRFAEHYETGEKIPADLVERIKASGNFLEGYQTLRQLSFGYLDMAWHTQQQPFNDDVKSFEEAAWKKTQIFPKVEGTCMSTQFGHLFAGGYAAGYYGYKWAEVLDADAFSLFREKGLFNREVATSFRKNILEKGGTEHPMTLYKRFRGKEPTVDALMERGGLK